MNKATQFIDLLGKFSLFFSLKKNAAVAEYQSSIDPQIMVWKNYFNQHRIIESSSLQGGSQ